MARTASPEKNRNGAPTAAPKGYRRRIRVIPQHGLVTALLEDDIHAMAVRLAHDGQKVVHIESFLDRMPWNTCPGAAAVLVDTFAGLPLKEVTLRKARKANCTHLHDLAVIAAEHAFDAEEICFDISVSDPVAGRRELMLQRNGSCALHWTEQDGQLVAPPEVAGRSLLTLRDALSAMTPQEAEAGRLLQWAGLVAHGRTIPLERQNDALKMPPNCYTFQPDRARVARRIGEVVDFSDSERTPGEKLSRELRLTSGSRATRSTQQNHGRE
ncbi:DUF2889 domain-containing protein [Novosphingobium sp. M1R2S20]|uniref:DUF2889 domain-containing protein n=1 Tax=Novosphingobium rhizovicinum TaxID=3228928 RepID=A0ABV3R8B9_9SPHN